MQSLHLCIWQTVYQKRLNSRYTVCVLPGNETHDLGVASQEPFTEF